MADRTVLDCVEHKLRPIEGSDEFTTEALLGAADLGVLTICLHLLHERRPVVIEGWGQAARFQRRETLLPAPGDLRASLIELRRVGYLAIAVHGGQAWVDYGPRSREIAARWGMEIEDS